MARLLSSRAESSTPTLAAATEATTQPSLHALKRDLLPSLRLWLRFGRSGQTEEYPFFLPKIDVQTTRLQLTIV